MQYVGGALVGFTTSLIAEKLGYGLDTWEHWAILALGLGIYLCAAYGGKR